MKKIVCLFSLAALFSQANLIAMHRKSMKRMYDRKRYQKKTKRQSFLQSRKFDKTGKSKKVSRKKKIGSVDKQLVDNQYTVGSFVNTLTPSLHINKNPLLLALLFPVVLASIVNGEEVTVHCKQGECYHGHEHECRPGDVYYQKVREDCTLKCTCKKFGKYWQYSCSGRC